jgi:hypothetical protein
VDLRAATRRELGSLGDPADLKFWIKMKRKSVAVDFATLFLLHGWSMKSSLWTCQTGINCPPDKLMSGKRTVRVQKTKSEESMSTFTASISRAFFGLAIPLACLAAPPAQAQSADTSFFVSSIGIGNGGDLGGLAGADKHCESLAQAAGAGGKTWRAYLSTQEAEGQPAVNARDRIGKGPWQNSKGVVVAKDVAELHGANNLTKQTALTEKGDVNNGRGDTPNRHDILTGSQPDGTAFPAGADRTCGNWTSSAKGAAMLGHADRIGLRDDDASRSWNSSHPSRGPDGGCSQNDLRSTGGDGLLYCFAAN